MDGDDRLQGAASETTPKEFFWSFLHNGLELLSTILYTCVVYIYTVSQKKLGRFYFYCNFVKCWPILIILSLSEPEIISAVI